MQYARDSVPSFRCYNTRYHNKWVKQKHEKRPYVSMLPCLCTSTYWSLREDYMQCMSPQLTRHYIPVQALPILQICSPSVLLHAAASGTLTLPPHRIFSESSSTRIKHHRTDQPLLLPHYHIHTFFPHLPDIRLFSIHQARRSALSHEGHGSLK